jgi:hypothetical protein
MKQSKTNILKSLGASASILLLLTGLGQGFGLISIDRLNKHHDLGFETMGIQSNLHPIQMKCIPHDKDASLNDPCKHLEESLNQHLKMLMSETQGDWMKITGNSSVNTAYKSNDPFAENSGIHVYYIIPIQMKCLDNLEEQDTLLHEVCIHFEESLNQHYKMFMTDTQVDRLKITGME